MAEPVIIKGRKMRLYAEDPAVAGTYKRFCLFTTRAFDRTKALQDSVVPSCDDPDAVPAVRRAPTSTSWTMSGSGIYEASDRAFIDAFLAEADSRNVRAELVDPAEGGYYQGKAYLNQLNLQGTDGQFVQASMTFSGDGMIAWTDSP